MRAASSLPATDAATTTRRSAKSIQADKLRRPRVARATGTGWGGCARWSVDEIRFDGENRRKLDSRPQYPKLQKYCGFGKTMKRIISKAETTDMRAPRGSSGVHKERIPCRPAMKKE
ncbi:hypothetical protein U9M48_022995 [Paspalum notatum var. saurae]|uniref:Uncharacterized protein n=1 Tax=Paspalum notatum var. saurae TaxID=547442 RepID=A0AAQ3WVH3_PASNO